MDEFAYCLGINMAAYVYVLSLLYFLFESDSTESWWFIALMPLLTPIYWIYEYRKILAHLLLAMALIMTFNRIAFAQAQPTGAPVTPMQNAISGVIQQNMKNRGFASNDPRYQSTLASVGGYAGSIATGAATGAIVNVATVAVLVTAAGVTAPAWGTVALIGAIGGAISVAISLGIDSGTKWIFGDAKTSSPVNVFVPAGMTAGSTIPQVTYPGGFPAGSAATFTAPNGFVYASSGTCQSLDALSSLSCAYVLDPGGKWGPCAPAPGGGVSCAVLMPNGPGGSYFYSNGNPAVAGSPGVVLVTAPTNPSQICKAGFALVDGACKGVGEPTQGTSTPAITGAKTLNDAVAAIPDSDKATKLNPELLAYIVNGLMQNAASQPGYDGVPISLTSPVTAADVQSWYQANPGSVPNVGDFVAPQPSSSSNPSPFGLPASETPVTSTSPTTTPSTGTNPSTEPIANLGPDPGIGSPFLEPTPTAQMILNPLLNLMPSLRNFVVPSHLSECPKPSMTFFNKSLVLDGHCTLLETSRPTLYAVMAFVWLIVALFIVLAA